MSQERNIKTIFGKKKMTKFLQVNNLSGFLYLLEDIFDAYILTNENLNVLYSHPDSEISIPENEALIPYIEAQLQDQFTKITEQVKRTKNAENFTLRFIRSKKAYNTKCSVIIDDNSNNYFLFTLIDNSLTQSLIEKLSNSEERFMAIVNNTYTWENWVNPHGDLIFVNPAVEKFTGYSFDESTWLFQHPEKYIHKDDFKRVVSKFNKSLQNETSGTDIFRILKKDKSISWISGSWNPVYSTNGKYLGLRSSLHDITEIKETQQLQEENLQKLKKLNDKLKKANKEIEESARNSKIFITNMSHLVRTPLNAILGMTELLYDNKLDYEQIELIEVIENSAENLLAVIHDIVDIKKIESEEIKLERKGLVLYEKMLSIFNISKLGAQRNNLDFYFNFPIEKKQLIVLTDHVRLNQLLLNVLNNAIKYTYKGYIKFEVNLINETNNNVIIDFVISDTGIGIASQNIKHIFTGFTKPGTQTAKKIEGSGLGLFICKKLVNAMGGEINVESVEGKGSVFTIKLKLEKGNKSDLNDRKHQKESLKTKHPKLENINLLLVEDQEFNQLLIKKITDNWDCNLEIANNGKEAVEMLKNNKYDIVLMDIQLPIMSGLQATQIIRNELPEPVRSIPIIALTANAIDGDNESFIESGMNDYIAKPFRSQVLYEMITRNLKGNDKKKTEMKTSTEKSKPENNKEVYSLKKILEIAKGDNSYTREMILVFIDQCLEIKESIMKALAEKDTKELGENAHKLKSSANIMCLTTIEKEIFEIVEISRSDKPDKKIFKLAELVLKELANIIPALKKELKNWLE